MTETSNAKQTLENMLKEPESLRMLMRYLILEHGIDVKDAVIGQNEQGEEVKIDGKQIKIQFDELFKLTKNLMMGMSINPKTEELILFTSYIEEDKDGIRYDNWVDFI